MSTRSKSRLDVPLRPQPWQNAGWAAVLGLLGAAELLYGRPFSIGWFVVGWLGLAAACAIVGTALRQGRLPRTHLVVDGDELVVPRSPAGDAGERIPFARVRHVYFLRRAPHRGPGPSLVLEAEDRTYELPFAWFASEVDQQKAAEALLELLAARAGG